MNSIEYELQVQMLQRLKDNEQLQQLNVQAYDVIPHTASYPYVSIDEITAMPYYSKTFHGLEVQAVVSVLSNTAGQGEVKKLLGIVRGAFYEWLPLRSGHVIDVQQVEGVRVVELRDESVIIPTLKQGIVTLRFVIKEAAAQI